MESKHFLADSLEKPEKSDCLNCSKGDSWQRAFRLFMPKSTCTLTLSGIFDYCLIVSAKCGLIIDC